MVQAPRSGNNQGSSSDEEQLLSLSDVKQKQLSSVPNQLESITNEEFYENFNLYLKETLKPREIAVIKLRFGMTPEGECTLSTVGERLGLSGERIRQIEAKALRKLRHPKNMLSGGGSFYLRECLYDLGKIRERNGKL